MRRQKMLDEVRSTRTGAAAAAAADDTSAAAAAAAATAAAAAAATNAAATTIARLEHELGEMAAAAAAAIAATAATTTAAAEEIARLQHELGEMTHRLMTMSTPKTFHPATRDRREESKWAAPALQPWSLRLQALCQTTKRLGHRRRSTAEEADRRGRPLAGPEPTANPDSPMLRLRPGHRPSHRTGEVCREVDGDRPVAHVGGLPCSLRMDDDPPLSASGRGLTLDW